MIIKIVKYDLLTQRKIRIAVFYSLHSNNKDQKQLKVHRIQRLRQRIRYINHRLNFYDKLLQKVLV